MQIKPALCHNPPHNKKCARHFFNNHWSAFLLNKGKEIIHECLTTLQRLMICWVLTEVARVVNESTAALNKISFEVFTWKCFWVLVVDFIFIQPSLQIHARVAERAALKIETSWNLFSAETIAIDNFHSGHESCNFNYFHENLSDRSQNYRKSLAVNELTDT